MHKAHSLAKCNEANFFWVSWLSRLLRQFSTAQPWSCSTTSVANYIPADIFLAYPIANLIDCRSAQWLSASSVNVICSSFTIFSSIAGPAVWMQVSSTSRSLKSCHARIWSSIVSLRHGTKDRVNSEAIKGYTSLARCLLHHPLIIERL